MGTGVSISILRTMLSLSLVLRLSILIIEDIEAKHPYYANVRRPYHNRASVTVPNWTFPPLDWNIPSWPFGGLRPAGKGKNGNNKMKGYYPENGMNINNKMKGYY